jgi:DNA-binding XRE family transcriptional regulator
MNADASNPALHFGHEVQRARVGAGMTLAEMGRVVGYHKSQISRVERGARAPTKKFAQMCDHAFPGRGGWFLRFYEDSRQWSAMPPWFRNWIEHEQRAVNLRIWQPSSLSGLLQTEAYAPLTRWRSDSAHGWPGRRSSPARCPPRRWCGS